MAEIAVQIMPAEGQEHPYEPPEPRRSPRQSSAVRGALTGGQIRPRPALKPTLGRPPPNADQPGFPQSELRSPSMMATRTIFDFPDGLGPGGSGEARSPVPPRSTRTVKVRGTHGTRPQDCRTGLLERRQRAPSRPRDLFRPGRIRWSPPGRQTIGLPGAPSVPAQFRNQRHGLDLNFVPLEAFVVEDLLLRGRRPPE